MLKIPGVTQVETLHTSPRTVIYRAVRDTQPVILKVPNTAYPSAVQLARWRREFEIGKDLDHEGIPTFFSLENIEGRLVIAMEDIGGEAVTALLQVGPLSLSQFLRYARQATKALAYLHAQGLIHKDIKPHNIIVNPATGALQLVDFGIASQLSHERARAKAPTHLEGTLAYIAPEQTGRTHRSIDQRSDLYALGGTFYHMLTGKPPFGSAGPMELVHCHLAQEPLPLHEARLHAERGALQMLGQIVSRLMAKNPEARYQSALGLDADLKRCEEAWGAQGTIPIFALASDDRSSTFRIPEQLYGRETSRAALLDAYQRSVAGTAQLLLVKGPSGIGKSALIHEVQEAIVADCGIYVVGKFDQFNKGTPYAGLFAAFQDLIRQLLTEPAEKLGVWREQINEAVAPNGQVLCDMLPEFGLLLNAQPPLAPLPPVEAQNRLQVVFRSLIGALAAAEHPLTLVLDDLQWADVASLRLLQTLLSSPAGQFLLLVGSYRDNEVEADHPLDAMLQELAETEAEVETVTLGPLSANDTNALIADTLRRAPEDTITLAEAVMEKTHGNPFFLRQFLAALARQGQFHFSMSEGSWSWDLEAIQALEVTDNVVALMTERLALFPAEAQDLLSLAACYGAEISLEDLAALTDQSLSSTAAKLGPFLEAGLLEPLGDAYKYATQWDTAAPQAPEPGAESDADALASLREVRYKFLHDRVQQAAYDMLDERARANAHLRIGRALQARVGDGLSAVSIDLVQHLNQGSDQIEDAREQLALVTLNLEAGQRALKAAAFHAAARFFQAGRRLLARCAGEVGIWAFAPALALALSIDGAEAALLSGQADEMKELLREAEPHAAALRPKMKIADLRFQGHMAEQKIQDALDTCLAALESLGHPFHTAPEEKDFVEGLTLAKTALGERSTAALEAMPYTEDPQVLEAMRFLSHAIAPAYFANPALFPQLVFKQAELSARHGNSSLAAHAYSLYALLLCGVLGDIDGGYDFGQLALRLAHHPSSQMHMAKVLHVHHAYVSHWKEPLRNAIPAFAEGVQYGLEHGDFMYTAFCAVQNGYYAIWTGESLAAIEERLATYASLTHRLKQMQVASFFAIWQQFVANARGQADDTGCLIGEFFDESEGVPTLVEAKYFTAVFLAHIAKLMLCISLERFEVAMPLVTAMEAIQDAAVGTCMIPEFNFYNSLVRLASCDASDEKTRAAHLEKVATNQAAMEAWATHAPSNHGYKYALIKAELAALAGQTEEAVALFDQAVSVAMEHQQVHAAALCNQRAAAYFLRQGRAKYARIYLADAHYQYGLWGAIGVQQHIEEARGQLLHVTTSSSTRRLTNTTYGGGSISSTETSSNASPMLDLATMLKASQAITEEIVLPRLLEKFLAIIIENAGAQRGLLLLGKRGHMNVEAHYDFAETQSVTLNSQPLREANHLAISVVDYVVRTRSDVVLHNATQSARFRADRYIQTQKPRSIICLPLLHQGELKGVIYMENNLIDGAFTGERREVILLLAGQASISIENARLYASLEEKVAARTHALRQALDEVETKHKALQETQSQLVQSEKMASLGTLVAGVAHELNNPANFSFQGAQNLSRRLQKLDSLLRQLTGGEAEAMAMFEEQFAPMFNNIESIRDGTARIQQIVRDLRTFSQLDHADYKESNVVEGLRSAMSLVSAGYGKDIIFTDNFQDEPSLFCWPAELNQAFMNILINACQAIHAKYGAGATSSGGKLSLSSCVQNDTLVLRFQDNGCGIDEAIQGRVFEPFFTTRSVGDGAGLGLSTAFSIAQKHNGDLLLTSTPGEGTTLTFRLPLYPKSPH